MKACLPVGVGFVRIIRFAFLLVLLLLACVAHSSGKVPLEVTLTADTVPVVGQEGVFTATVSAKRDLPNISIEIQPMDEGQVDSTLTLPSISKQTPVRFTAKVIFSTPGLKRVRAVAKSTVKPGVIWSAVAYVTLNVGEKSSSIITDTRSMRTPPKQRSKGTGKMLGRPKADKSGGKPVPQAAETDVTALSEPQPNTADLVISGKWSFIDRHGLAVGMRYHRVELIKMIGTTEMLVGVTQTDVDGNFVFDPEAYSANNFYVRCSTTYDGPGNDVSVILVPGQYFSSDTNLFNFATGGNHSVGEWTVNSSDPHYKAWWVCDDMVKACFTAPDPIGAHTAWFDPIYNGGAHYSPGGRIYLFANDVDDTPDTILHEMGHSVMYNIYGDYMPDAPNCSPHSLMGDSSTGCAWTEGWAQIWHMWSTNDQYRDYPGGGKIDLEAATWGDGNDEGSDVEGRVAGALWDIADSVNDGYDTYSGGWSDIWHIMYHHNCDKFSEFWSQWQSHGFNTHGAVACIYQNTIDWNESPVITPLPDVTVAEDEFRANAIDLDSYASDPESQDYQLQFSIASVSDPNLQIGINANHEINLQGMPNWSGWADVVVSCTDGVDQASATFRVTVTPVNDAPVVSGLPDKTLNEDGSLSNTIDVQHFATDAESTSSQLTYAITGNTNASCGVTLTSNRYISINPTANWFGTSDVTIRATDPEGLYDEDTFRITVNSVNDAPVIAGLPDRTMNEDGSLNNTIDLWAYATDIELPSSALTYVVSASQLPAGAVTIDSNRYIDINPPANLNGQFDVTIQAWDFESGVDQDSFRVTINPMADPPVINDIPDQLIESPKTMGYSRSVDLHRYASDPDGPVTELTFNVHRNTNTSISAAIESNRYLRIGCGLYYSGYTEITIRAADPTGNVAEDTINVVVGRSCEDCTEACNVIDGAYVIFDRKTVTVSHAYAFYMEDDSRLSGMRVASTLNPDEGRYVTVGGQITTENAERLVTLQAVVLGGTDATPPEPFMMVGKALGGVHPSSTTRAVPEGRVSGLYNVGMLVKTTGKVVSRTANSFWIDDGTGVPYSFSTKGLYVDCQPIAMYAPTLGSYVTVTGASGATLVGENAVNALRLRSRSDVRGMGGRVAYIYNTGASTASVYAALLADYGWSVTPISITDLLTTDLSGYHLVMLGTDTGTWTDSAKVSYLVDSDKPIIAMGTGGAQFLDQVADPDLYIGSGNSMATNLTQGYVADLSSVLYWWEKIIPVPGDRLLEMFTSSTTAIQLANPPAGVYGLLRNPTLSQYWPIAQQGRFMQWGFHTLPSSLNPVAKDLLSNSLYYMQGK